MDKKYSSKIEKKSSPETEVGQAFIKFYYTQFDTDRSKLSGIYKDSSKVSYEGEMVVGTGNIITKLSNLKFKKVQHAIKTIDCQDSGCGGIIIFVTGDMKIDEGQNGIKFSQAFHIMPTDQTKKNYWVHNDVFRLNYG